MIILTFWEHARIKNDPEDYDGLLEVRLKTVKQIPELLAHMPKRTVMVSTEYSGDHKRNGKLTNKDNPRWFKEIWREGDPLPLAQETRCPLCGKIK